MKVGILGSGEVARSLAAGFIKHRHEVTMGTRDRGKLTDFAKKHTGVRVGSFADAAQFGEIIVLAVKGTAAKDVLEAAGTANLAGKTVLDTTNPIADRAPKDGVIYCFTSPDESLMARLQTSFPDVNFVKAFSCVGSALMVDPNLKGGKPTMFIAGNNASARKTAAAVCQQFGFEVEDCGTVEAARAVEALAVLWCIPGFLKNDWVHAFKLLRP